MQKTNDRRKENVDTEERTSKNKEKYIASCPSGYHRKDNERKQ